MDNSIFESMIFLLNVHMKHYEQRLAENEPELAEKQKIYYDGIFTAYDYLFIGSEYVLTGRYTTNHKIGKREE